MLASIELSAKSLDYLNRRQLSQQEVNAFQDLLQRANQEADAKQLSGKMLLSQLNANDLALLKKANSLADDINVAELSEEGAINLLRQPDNSDRVDLNNDGIVEVGIGKSMVFPPVNAPDFVKAAWEEATADMSESDVMHLQLTMHITVFGINIDDQVNQSQPSAQQQWSKQGIDKLFTQLRSALDFAVGLDGWTAHNKMLQQFYDGFEDALNQSATLSISAGVNMTQGTFSQPLTPEETSAQDDGKGDESTDSPQRSSQRIIDLMQAVLDARMGIDREKLKEIEDKIAAISNDKKLSKTQKKQLIEQLEKMKENILDQAEKELTEYEKRKAMLNQNSTLLASLSEDLIKSEMNKNTVFSA